MTSEELAKFDGCDGRAAYVAVSGVIYDVSSSPRWDNGEHEGTHQAGQDLTAELKLAPHVRTLIERFPVVGQLKTPEDTEQKSTPGISLLSIIIIAFVTLLMIATYMI
ncbi:MAG: cytochrome b5 domain-containing protein [Desulfuromusa sp.]|jgi:predicted heme/steroid binding protein|nr:cytochrome b5 domain-containing protein [Desulfuromusa sp.]